jgi:hypothetical protein
MDVEYFKQIQDKCRELVIEKNKAYGEKNISQFGMNGVIVRMTDKLNRLINLAYNKENTDLYHPPSPGVGNQMKETVIDTLMDIANYAIIGIMLLEGKWGTE